MIYRFNKRKSIFTIKIGYAECGMFSFMNDDVDYVVYSGYSSFYVRGVLSNKIQPCKERFRRMVILSVVF